MRGRWTSHAKYGKFEGVLLHHRAAATMRGIQRYPGSGLLKGIGFKTAGTIAASAGIARDSNRADQGGPGLHPVRGGRRRGTATCPSPT